MLFLNGNGLGGDTSSVITRCNARRCPWNRRLARQGFPHDDRRSIDVRAVIDSEVRCNCSGAMYAILPRTSLSRVTLALPTALAMPKSRMRATPSVPDDDVGRNVAVYDLERSAVCVSRFVGGVQASQHVGHDRSDDRRGSRLAQAVRCAQQFGEGFPVNVLHHERQLGGALHDIERRNDVRMLNLRDHARLVREHRNEVQISRELGVQTLDRDRGQVRIIASIPEVNGGHTAGSTLSK